MALDATKFHTNSGGGRQIHSYDGAADALATIVASGYFNAITGRLHKGDTILLAAVNGTVTEQVLVTSATGAATVTVAAAA